MAGGVGEYCSNPSTPAGETSFLVDVTPGANHTVQEEALAFPRVVSYLFYWSLLYLFVHRVFGKAFHYLSMFTRAVLKFCNCSVGLYPRNPYSHRKALDSMLHA